MGTTVRLRFVAFDLVDPWVELRRKGLWTLMHPGRPGKLTLSLFPVADGVTMDLETLQALSHKRQQRSDEVFRRVPEARRRGRPRAVLLDETSWLQGSVFCFATSVRQGPAPRPSWGASPEHSRYWTVSDGAHVLEATFYEYDQGAFVAGVEDCNAMVRSVRFEGSS